MRPLCACQHPAPSGSTAATWVPPLLSLLRGAAAAHTGWQTHCMGCVCQAAWCVLLELSAVIQHKRLSASGGTPSVGPVQPCSCHRGRRLWQRGVRGKRPFRLSLVHTGPQGACVFCLLGGGSVTVQHTSPPCEPGSNASCILSQHMPAGWVTVWGSGWPSGAPWPSGWGEGRRGLLS